MNNVGALIAVARVVVAVGVAVVLFRLQREIRMVEQEERTWVAFCDWLAILATLVALLFVMLPLLVNDPAAEGRLPAAAATMSVILTAGWFPAALAHYRLFFGTHRTGPRANPEPAEGRFVALFVALSAVAFVVVYAWPAA